VQVDLTFCELRRGDTLLLCSDGLSGMVRFEEIREVLRSSSEPLEVCKALTERANQAGGHDNITVIVVQFDGETLRSPEGDQEPLKYRKYILGEEADSTTMPTANAHAMGQGAGGEIAPDGTPRAPAVASLPPPGGGWQDHIHPDDSRIDIPGTHVPLWMVAGIVLGVIVLLAGAAWLFLHS